MVLKRSSVWLLIGMIILSMVLPSLQAMAKEGEKSVDTSQASEEIEDSTEEVEAVKTDEVEVEVVEKTEPPETVEPEKTVVDEKMEILVSNLWVNVPEAGNPPSITLSLVNTRTGEQVKSVTLANGEKSYLFGGLSKYGEDGSLNKYGLRSSEVANYKTTIDNYTATHTYIQLEAKGESAVEETEEEQETDVVEEVSMSIMPMAIATPGNYTTDPNSIVVKTTMDDKSTNDHTRAALLWASGDVVHVAVNATHELTYMDLNNVRTVIRDEYNPLINIKVDGISYDPKEGLQGSTQKSYWTVFKYNLADLKLNDTGIYSFFIKGQGGGHDVGGTLLFEIPKEDITGEKVWVGGTERPAITLQLKRHVSSGTKVDVETGVVNGNETTPWQYKWKKVNKYDPYGRQYIYTVDEVNIPPNYTKSLDGLKVTNTYDPTLVFINVNKVWIGPATESVTIKLYADNVDTGKTVVLNGNNSWRDVFTGLNKFNDRSGDKINYSVEEVAIAGYSTVKTVAENGFTFTNTNDSKTTVDVKKEWVGSKTDSVTITLLANDEDTGQTLVLNEDNDWKGSFTDLRKYDATTGEYIDYDVVEHHVPDGYEVSYRKGDNGEYIVTNTGTVGSLTVLKVNKAEEALAGATFELWDADGNLIGTETTGSSGEVYFGNLSWGEYQLKEMKAPDGYRKLLQPISISIGPGDSLHIEKTVVNTKNGWIIPKTGGIGTAGFYGFGGLLMALTFGFFLRKRKDRLNENEQSFKKTSHNGEGKKQMLIKKLFAVMMIALLTFMTMATGPVAHAEAGDVVRTTGSLTIYKYEVEPDYVGEDGDGTGGQQGGIPEDKAKLLDGVTFKITKTHNYDPVTDKWTSVANGAVHEEVTENGVASFDGLALGRYTVEETSGPAHVNLNPNIYSVDVPMTSADGTKINYDVHIYPKNEIIRGAVELLKRNGENKFAPLAGAKFTLHYANGTEVSPGTIHVTGANGLIPVDALAYAKDYYFKEIEAPAGFMIQSGKHEFSISASGAFVSGESTGTIEKVTIDNYYKPDIEKKADKKDANRGDTLTYTLTIDLPGDIKAYKNFVITDELDSRLSYVAGSESGPAGFAFNASGQTLTWTATHFAALESGKVTITFDVVIAEDAEGGSIGNTSSIDYENQSGTTGDKETPPTTITLTDGGFKVLKVDEANTTIKLPGAVFKLTDEKGKTVDAIGTLITVNGVLHNGPLEGLVTDANGEIKIDGLDVGTYYLVETKAPTYKDENDVTKSYRLLTKSIQVDVTATDTSANKKVYVKNSKSGWNLPKTGGIGTTLFTGIGLLLMGAAVFIFARREKTASK